ncbi:phosphoglycerate mutase-like protein [Violaceomyces palustris]|uniref:Phosphoglycerate mutase-like protein n=1 Tax=Violaceomyces palustris TaxID=1673888 RepID=A0ACD0NUY0_9BASI|nr:phosphoglycerate mutase-like protein [Violaceomyces palustris]
MPVTLLNQHWTRATDYPSQLSQTDLPSIIFQNVGQYSPWFDAGNTDQDWRTPDGCQVVFVNQLERHGSRYPTSGSYSGIASTLVKIANHLDKVSYSGPEDPVDPTLRFLRNYTSSASGADGGLKGVLGNAELVPFGQFEAFRSGRDFSERYSHLFQASVDVNSDYRRDLKGSSRRDQASFEALGTRQSSSNSDEFSQRPFVRASGGDRVVASSRFWLQGFHNPRRPFLHTPPSTTPWPPKGTTEDDYALKNQQGKPNIPLPNPDVIISEKGTSNNTLDVYTCTKFESSVRNNATSLSQQKQDEFSKSATLPILERWSKGFSKTDQNNQAINLTNSDVLNLFSLCAFDTVARLDPYDWIRYDDDDDDEESQTSARRRSSKDAISKVCGMFERNEFGGIYEVVLNIEKSYGFGPDQPFSRALATPWLRELLARLRSERPRGLEDQPTALNTTLDSNPSTFPLPPTDQEYSDFSSNGRSWTTGGKPTGFVDFTHDNQLAPIISSLGLIDFGGEGGSTGWNTAKTTPFDGRLTVEKLYCPSTTTSSSSSDQDFYIRLIVNGKVRSTKDWCQQGREEARDQLCPQQVFLKSLDWVQGYDEWSKCYA